MRAWHGIHTVEEWRVYLNVVILAVVRLLHLPPDIGCTVFLGPLCYHKFGSSQQTFIISQSGGQKSKVKVPAESFLASSRFWCLLASLGLWLHNPNLCLCFCMVGISPSPPPNAYQELSLHLGPTLIQYHLFSIFTFTSVKILFPNKVIF